MNVSENVGQKYRVRQKYFLHFKLWRVYYNKRIQVTMVTSSLSYISIFCSIGQSQSRILLVGRTFKGLQNILSHKQSIFQCSFNRWIWGSVICNLKLYPSLLNADQNLCNVIWKTLCVVIKNSPVLKKTWKEFSSKRMKFTSSLADHIKKKNGTTFSW